MSPIKNLILLIILAFVGTSYGEALNCSDEQFRYGENDIVDELLTCSLSQSFDLDLTPQGDRVKATSKALVEQGFSNKTSIIHARLSGLWTAKRPNFIESGWKCDASRITSTSIIELNSVTLEVIERLDVQIHRNQHKLAIHKPCKTFDLPVWMCRQSKPIYRTTTTWVNRAYFNLTLVQRSGESRPAIERLTPIFTCPETFKQKITHSPSATYIIARHMDQLALQPLTATYRSSESMSSETNSRVRRQSARNPASQYIRFKMGGRYKKGIADEPPEISHPSSFSTSQSGKMPVAPPYHNSVKIITHQIRQALSASLSSCIQLVDSDLSLMADHKSFSEVKYPLDRGDDAHQDAISRQTDEQQANIKNECASHSWIKSRIELANQAQSFEAKSVHTKIGSNKPHTGHSKRNQLDVVSRPDEGDQLLNPYENFHRQPDILDQMVDDI